MISSIPRLSLIDSDTIPQPGFGVLQVPAAHRNEAAVGEANAFPIGKFVATLRLPADQGICTARWGSEGHLSVWGEALMLAQSAADIVRVVD